MRGNDGEAMDVDDNDNTVATRSKSRNRSQDCLLRTKFELKFLTRVIFVFN